MRSQDRNPRNDIQHCPARSQNATASRQQQRAFDNATVREATAPSNTETTAGSVKNPPGKEVVNDWMTSATNRKLQVRSLPCMSPQAPEPDSGVGAESSTEQGHPLLGNEERVNRRRSGTRSSSLEAPQSPVCSNKGKKIEDSALVSTTTTGELSILPMVLVGVDCTTTSVAGGNSNCGLRWLASERCNDGFSSPHLGNTGRSNPATSESWSLTMANNQPPATATEAERRPTVVMDAALSRSARFPQASLSSTVGSSVSVASERAGTDECARGSSASTPYAEGNAQPRHTSMFDTRSHDVTRGVRTLDRSLSEKCSASCQGGINNGSARANNRRDQKGKQNEPADTIAKSGVGGGARGRQRTKLGRDGTRPQSHTNIHTSGRETAGSNSASASGGWTMGTEWTEWVRPGERGELDVDADPVYARRGDKEVRGNNGAAAGAEWCGDDQVGIQFRGTGEARAGGRQELYACVIYASSMRSEWFLYCKSFLRI